MIILNIYVVTIILAMVSTFLLVCETKVYCKEHKIRRAEKQILSRRLLNELKLLLMCIIPLYNLFLAFVDIYTFLSSSMFEKVVQNNIDNGTFIRGE